MIIVLYSLRGDKRMLEKLAKGTARFFVAQNIVEAEYEAEKIFLLLKPLKFTPKGLT